jgi:hypothetical protein
LTPKLPRHHGMEAERPHEVGEDVVSVFARVVIGDHAAGLDRRAGIARVADFHRDAVRCRGEGRRGVAVTERAVARDIGAELVMQGRRARRERGERIDERGQRIVIDFDEIERVLGEIAIGGHHDRDRLAHVARALDRDRPAFERRPQHGDEGRGQRRDFGPGDHRGDARSGGRCLGADRADVGVRVGGTQNRGVQGAGGNAEVVDVTASSGQERSILDPLDRPTEPTCCRGHPHLPFQLRDIGLKGIRYRARFFSARDLVRKTGPRFSGSCAATLSSK